MQEVQEAADKTIAALQSFRDAHPSGRRRGVTVAPYPSHEFRKTRRKVQKASRRGNR